VKRKVLISIPALIATLAFIVWFVDPFLVGAFMSLPLLAAIPCFVIGLVWLVVSRTQGRSIPQPCILIFTAFAMACLAWPTLTANRWVHQRAADAAKHYPEQVSPLLEAYRREHGAYPRSLDQLPSKPPMPRLLRKSYSYKSDGRTYSFSFAQPGGLIDTWHYDSETHTWYLET